MTWSNRVLAPSSKHRIHIVAGAPPEVEQSMTAVRSLGLGYAIFSADSTKLLASTASFDTATGAYLGQGLAQVGNSSELSLDGTSVLSVLIQGGVPSGSSQPWTVYASATNLADGTVLTKSTTIVAASNLAYGSNTYFR